MAVCVALVALVLWGWLTARRSLWPRADATVVLPGLDAPVEIAFDRWGVPHIRASSRRDALFAEGYAHARDRFFQMELGRRAAFGRLAELLGEAALPSDVKLRRWCLGRTAVRQLGELDAETLAVLDAYVAGVNAAIATRGAIGLAPELAFLGADIEPWRAADTVGIGLLTELSLTFAAGEELKRAAELRGLGPDRAVALWRWSAEQAAAWIPGDGGRAAPRTERDVVLPPASSIGSNNWTLAGARTSTGLPLLANDIHLGVANPSTWYEAHLEAPGLALAGGTIPGTPGLIFGHNADLAWGFTMVVLDDQDLFTLQLDPTGRRERIGREWRDLALYEEQIAVRGRREPEKVTVRVSIHGPVVREEKGEVLAMSWTALVGPSPLPCFLRLNEATSVAEGAAAFAECGAPAMNLVMADRGGHIRWQVIGKVPVRGRGAGRLPAPGWDPDWQWRGLRPFGENPYLEDPPGGELATANHDPFAERDFPPPAFPGEFAAPWRVRTIRSALASRERWDVDGSLELQLSVDNPQARELLVRLRPHLERIGTPAAQRLLAWNGRMDIGSPDALLWAEFLREFERRVGGDEAGRSGLPSTPIRGNELLELLEGSLDPAWWDDVTTPTVEGAQQIIGSALAAAGSRVGSGRWGDAHVVSFHHPLGSIPLLGALLDRGPFPVGGGAPCVDATAYSAQGRTFEVIALPSQRLVADLADWDRSVFTLPLGQSGHFLSRFAADQTPDWLAGRVHPMAWSHDAVRDSTIATVRLEPSGRR